MTSTAFTSFHATVYVGNDIELDEKLAGLIQELWAEGFTKMTGSCQNYGEYLRSLGFDWNHESTRDYVYFEFPKLVDALELVDYILDVAGPVHPLTMRIANPSTPGAWELRFLLDWRKPWLLFPTVDIDEVSQLLASCKAPS